MRRPILLACGAMFAIAAVALAVPHPYTDPFSKGHPRMMFPRGTTNLALNKKVTSSDRNPQLMLSKVTDGDKEAKDESCIVLAEGRQWVQIDLEQPSVIQAIVIWHFLQDPRVYMGVVIQASNDPEFREGVHTLLATKGLGERPKKDEEWGTIESHHGMLVQAGGVEARYVRLYSNGNTSDDNNHYVEVEVHGLPATAAATRPATRPADLVPLELKLPKPGYTARPRM